MRLFELLFMLTVPEPLSETTPEMVRSVALPPEFRLMRPLLVLLPVSPRLELSLMATVPLLFTVVVGCAPVTVTVRPEAISARSRLPGTKPQLHDAATFQFPAAGFQVQLAAFAGLASRPPSKVAAAKASAERFNFREQARMGGSGGWALVCTVTSYRSAIVSKASLRGRFAPAFAPANAGVPLICGGVQRSTDVGIWRALGRGRHAGRSATARYPVASGRCKVTDRPPRRWLRPSVSVAPWLSAIALTMARPRPLPGASAVAASGVR